MSSPLYTTSSKLAKFTYFVDEILCNRIGNPIVLSFVAAVLAITLFVLSAIKASTHDLAFLSIDDYVQELWHNLVNIMFIIRFPSHSRNGLARKSNKAFEILLFLAQNAGIAMLMLPTNYSLLYTDCSKILKFFMLSQIIAPYVVLAMTVVEKLYSKEESEKAGSFRPDLKRISMLTETNNNLLPVFITHSFAFVSFTFQLADAPRIVLLYKLVCCCLKFTLIHRFILHVVVVFVNGENVKDYAELYRPVSLENQERTWKCFFREHETAIMAVCASVLIAQDMGIIAILKFFVS
ncbi:hypothetical protein A9F13_13g00814 [Clavispora lusitaniae]|uniref:Uncharacterized protein n=1 Tax=Clavispora lusitaniae TaxID=36911 RepID=A0AA91T0U9_CLALS|nr:hypothetical protein A9F13_13g00814 [Clavispora lusitaniae]